MPNQILVTGSGQSVTVDGSPNTNFRISCVCTGPDPAPFPQPDTGTVAGQRFQVHDGAGQQLIFEDTNASYVVDWEFRPDLGTFPDGDPWRCPKFVDIAGLVGSMNYSLHMENFRWDEAHEKIVCDYTVVADAGLLAGGGQSGETDPPIVHH
jgi:hypothetical protein